MQTSPEPGDRRFEPKTLEELLEHWRRGGQLRVPDPDGRQITITIDLVVEARYAGTLPIHAIVRGRSEHRALQEVFGVHVGRPPSTTYPIALLVVERLPGGPGDLYWHRFDTPAEATVH